MTDGTLVTAQQRAVIRFERHLPHPPETVFSALVDPAELAAWFPCTIDGDWREGSPLRFVFEQWPDEDARSGGNGTDDWAGEVRVCDPPRLLEYTWGDGLLRFELTPAGDGTDLVFTHGFDADGPFPSDKIRTGWHQCLDGLGAQLDGETPDMRQTRWLEINGSYEG